MERLADAAQLLAILALLASDLDQAKSALQDSRSAGQDTDALEWARKKVQSALDTVNAVLSETPWPRTPADHRDRSFFDDPPSGTSPEYVRAWYDRQICGCGDHLESDRERDDGICENCRELGVRTPRPSADGTPLRRSKLRGVESC